MEPIIEKANTFNNNLSKSQKDEVEFKEIDGQSKILNIKNILKELKKNLVKYN